MFKIYLLSILPVSILYEDFERISIPSLHRDLGSLRFGVSQQATSGSEGTLGDITGI